MAYSYGGNRGKKKRRVLFYEGRKDVALVSKIVERTSAVRRRTLFAVVGERGSHGLRAQ